LFVFLYKGKKSAKWVALTFVLLNIWANNAMADLIDRGKDAASPGGIPIELQISTALCFISLLFLLASFWTPKQKGL